MGEGVISNKQCTYMCTTFFTGFHAGNTHELTRSKITITSCFIKLKNILTIFVKVPTSKFPKKDNTSVGLYLFPYSYAN